MTDTAESAPRKYDTARPAVFDFDEISFESIWRSFLRRKYLVVAIVIIGIAAGIAISQIATPVYRVSALLAPTERDVGTPALAGFSAQLGGLASLSGLDLSASSSGTDEALAILVSRNFTAQFLRDENLLPVLFADDWDSEAQAWLIENSEDQPSYWDGYELFNKTIRRVREDNNTGFVTLSVEWPDPHEAARWVTLLVERLNAKLREAAIAESQQNIEFLEEALKETSQLEIQSVIFNVIESQLKTAMLANVQRNYAFKVIDPPAVPDADAYIWPNRMLLVGGGGIIALLLALAIILLDSVSSRRPDAKEQ